MTIPLLFGPYGSAAGSKRRLHARVPSAISSGPPPIDTDTAATSPAAVPVTVKVPITLSPASGDVISNPVTACPGSLGGAGHSHSPKRPLLPQV